MSKSGPEWLRPVQRFGTKVDPSSVMKAGPIVKTAGSVVQQHVVFARLIQYLEVRLSQ